MYSYFRMQGKALQGKRMVSKKLYSIQILKFCVLACSEFRKQRFRNGDQTGARRKDVCLGEIERRDNAGFFLDDILSAVWYKNSAFKITSMHCKGWLAFVEIPKRQCLFNSSLLQ